MRHEDQEDERRTKEEEDLMKNIISSFDVERCCFLK
jgi:hypothetical protein